jgi:hypothetical protein
MRENTSATVLDPDNPASWTDHPFEVLFSLPRAAVEEAQRQAVIRRFECLRHSVVALDKLASRQGVTQASSLEEVLPAFFDHRVLKSYPVSLIERHQLGRLSSWLGRLSTHDIEAIPLDGVDSVDGWFERLDERGMFLVHSTGTTGKLSIVPRSKVELPASRRGSRTCRWSQCSVRWMR